MKKGKDNSSKKRIIRIFTNLKQEKEDEDASPLIPVYDKKKFIAYLRIISSSSLNNPQDIKNLASWRNKHNWWFPAQFKATLDGTKRWLENLLLNQRDRLLFMLETPSGAPFGHMGFFRFDFKNNSCEVDNIVRGKNLIHGGMTPSLKTLINWAFSVLKVRSVYLKTYFDNERAIRLYKRCGFEIVKKIPLKKIIEGNMTRWEEDPKLKKNIERYHVQMKYKINKLQ